MADQQTIETLLASFRAVLESGAEVNAAEVPYIIIKGDIDGKGILWSGEGHNKQLIFAAKPDRFFVSETIDLAKGRSVSINNVKVLDERELGPTITKSNLREVGHLKGLIVDGGLSVNQYLVYDANTNRLGLGTDQPKAAISIVDQNNPNAWPVSSASFVIMYKNPDDKAASQEVLKFFDWAFRNGKNMSNELDYVHLPTVLQDQIRSRVWSQIK